MGIIKRLAWLAFIGAVGALSAGNAFATQSVKLSASFEPNKFRASATVNIEFWIRTPSDQAPSPLIGTDIRLPAGVGLSTSELGLATCDAMTLDDQGPSGCSRNALMGYGSALVAVPDGFHTLYEPVDITVVMGPPSHHHTAMLLYASGTSPVIAQLVFQSTLLGDSEQDGTALNTSIPLISGLPGEPTARVVRFQVSIGPKGLTYYKRVHDATVAYSPQGIIIPAQCPTGGFPFEARFMFADGTSVSATDTAPCPLRGAGAKVLDG